MLEKMMEAENATLLGFKMGMDSVCIGGWGIGEMWRDFLDVCFLCVCFCFRFLFLFCFLPFYFWLRSLIRFGRVPTPHVQ